MQAAVRGGEREDEKLSAVLPLYGASLIVTLAGVGAVGSIMFSPLWTPIWATLALLGHGVSLFLRRLGVTLEQVFYPVMLLGTVVVMQLLVAGSPMVGMDSGIGAMSIDMMTATAVAALAVVRSFTLVSNSSLLFSPVPAITMLALTGSSNINAEIPLFFGLLVFGSLFIIGYEAHLRRAVRTGKSAVPVIFHLANTWSITLLVAGIALAFPLLVQPVLGPLSPFAGAGVARFRALLNFTQTTGNQSPVGAGPITLSATPVYEVMGRDAGRYRTNVYTRYTGRSWTQEPAPSVMEFPATAEDGREEVERNGRTTSYKLYRFELPGDPELSPDVPVREVTHRFITRGYVPNGIPSLGYPSGLRYPRSTVQLLESGVVQGNGHQSSGRLFDVTSRVPEFDPSQLRQVPMGDVDELRRRMPEALALQQSTFPVQELARRITAAAPNPYDKVQAIVNYIQENTQYTLQEEVTPPGQDAAVFYLFTTKRGACDLAATSVALMCRSIGIPARVAVGYLAQEPLPSGQGFLIRQQHAHMWAEVYFDQYGWVPFDPAPPLASIRDNPILVAWYRLLGAFRKIGGGGLDAILFVVLVIATLALVVVAGGQRLLAWVRRQRRQGAAVTEAEAVVQTYDRAMTVLLRRGWSRESWMTAREYLEWMRDQWRNMPEASAALKALELLSQAYQRARYAETATPEELAAVRRAFDELRRGVPRRPLRSPGRAGVDAQGRTAAEPA